MRECGKDLLQPCIERGFTPEERLSAYKLLILCQIYNDDIGGAHEGMLAFLKKYPEYELSPTDPDEFRFNRLRCQGAAK